LGYSESRSLTLFGEKLSIVKQSLGSYYESNDEMLFHCPRCNHHKRKLSVNVERSVFKCWICDFKGTDLLPLIRDRELRTRWKSLTQQVDMTRFDDLFSEETSAEPVQILELPKHFSTLTTPNLSKIGQKAKKYLLSRGVTQEQMLLYKMGFCFHGLYGNRVIIPSYDNQGVLNYYIARSFDKNPYKYKNPSCSRDIIFNDVFIDWDRPVVLVEGFFDSLKYNNSIPILGSTLNPVSNLFNKIVSSSKTVYVCLDKDAKQKELKIIKNLLDFGVKVYKIEIYEYCDLAEVPDSLLKEYKNRASIMTREDYLLQKLDFGG
jgi:DNA primase